MPGTSLRPAEEPKQTQRSARPSPIPCKAMRRRSTPVLIIAVAILAAMVACASSIRLRDRLGHAIGLPFTGEWASPSSRDPRPKAEILRQWDEDTATIDALWPQIRPAQFQETMTAFGQYPGRVHDLVLYAIDNEIHHRGQGYVYLRALGIDPPPFYERE